MMPDTAETRIGRLEREMAGLQQRVEDISADVRALTPLVVATAELKIAVSHVQQDMHDLATDVAAARATINEQVGALRKTLRDDRDERERAQRDALKDSRQWRRALILGSFTVLAAIIAAAATIIAAGGHP